MQKIKDATLFKQQCFINGEWRVAENQASVTIKNPTDDSVLGCVPEMGAHETRLAIEAAHQALPQWSALTAKERATILRRWHTLIMESQDDLARIITLEQGKPLAEARGEIAYGASYVEWFAEEARRVYGEIIPSTKSDQRLVVIRQPIGVVAAITPWNFPNAMIARKLAPALAAGCTAVVKPAPQTPFSAFALAVLAERAGIPKGVINIITGVASAIGAEMTQNPKVRKLSFTGSTAVGRELMRACGDTIKKLSLELGGNAPFIVFADADLDAAVAGAMLSKFRNNGQTCVCANRFFIHDRVFDQFSAKLAEKMATLRVGNGLEANIDVGPLIDARAVNKVETHIADAIKEGATLRMGGKRLQGNFFQPTLLTEVLPTMLIAREETFGPVAGLIRFKDDDEVIRMANDTISGLAAYIYTGSLRRSWEIAEGLEYGMVGVNTGLVSTVEAPFGGVKQSGLGREGSKHGIDDYTELKYICMTL